MSSIFYILFNHIEEKMQKISKNYIFNFDLNEYLL